MWKAFAITQALKTAKLLDSSCFVNQGQLYTRSVHQECVMCIKSSRVRLSVMDYIDCAVSYARLCYVHLF